jgi:hypothetical protein
LARTTLLEKEAEFKRLISEAEKQIDTLTQVQNTQRSFAVSVQT